MTKEAKFTDAVFKNSDQLVVKIDDVGTLTLIIKLTYDPTSRNPPGRTIELDKAKALDLAKFINESEANLPLARGVPA